MTDIFEAVFRDSFTPLDTYKRVGNFSVGKEIGRGAFGTVRRGRSLLNGEQVAIKIVPKRSILQRERTRRRFCREAHALQKLEHSNIVKYFECMETDSNFYLVLEFIAGETLRNYMKSMHRLSENEVRRYIMQIATAINYMHGKDILHRDLKLDNIVLENNGNIKIVDFGLSMDMHMYDNLQQCGSPAYIAPEILSRNKFTTAADVWSLGVCMSYLLTGNHPFPLDSSVSFKNMICYVTRACILPSYLSQECKDLLTKKLIVDPRLRITTEEILAHTWLSG